MPKYEELEIEYAKYVGTKFAVSTNTGTSALHLALLAIGVGKESEVILCQYGMIAPAFAISYCGATPVFVDCDDNLLIDVKKIKTKITSKTKAILAVHTYGRICQMDEIMEIAKKYNLRVIEDACFASGTKILTSKGEKNIEDIKVGELVLTRRGYKKVLASWQTGIKKVITRFGITATPDHPFITTKGIKRFDTLCGSDIIYKCDQESLLIEEKSIIDNQSQNLDNTEYTIGIIHRISHLSHCIGKYGLTILVKYLKNILFTTKMAILSIIKYPIFSYSQNQNILGYTCLNQKELRCQEKVLKLPELKQRNGILVKRELNFIENGVEMLGKMVNILPTQKFVHFVAKHTKHIFQLNQDSVLGNAKKEEEQSVPVYNLTIEDTHEFFANSILVHNCECQGGMYKNKMVGTFDIGVFSFYINKIIPAEEGGMITTNDEEVAKKARYLKNMAFSPAHDFMHDEIGFNYRMSNSQANYALGNLRNINLIQQKRYQVKDWYDQYLKKEYQMPDTRSVIWVYDCFIPQKDKVVALLNEKGIQARHGFKPMSMMPMYFNKNYVKTNAYRMSQKVMYLPVSPLMTEEMVKDICKMVNEIL